MIMLHHYPISPASDHASDTASTTPETKKSTLVMPDEAAASVPDNPPKAAGVGRRTRPPPRDEQGQMYCDHINCRGRGQTFKRACEWNKHMDRHERPYKCREAGCEVNPGFTYSGGLLRHQREVHKMHLSTKQPLFCPFPNCNRSSGAGFTRKENLEEHKRRRHLEEMSDHAAARERELSRPRTATPLVAHEPAAKRRKLSRPISTEAAAQSSLAQPEVANLTLVHETAMSESQQIQQLQDTLRQKDDYIRRQANELHRLHNFLRSLPPQTIYGAIHSQVPGSGVG